MTPIEAARSGEMQIISFIDQPEVIRKILQHLGLWEEYHPPRFSFQESPQTGQDSAATQFNSSLIASWGSDPAQTQA